ncbi:MAG: homocysteine S-methyltransferase family protein [Elusimicrobiota bacterium]
MRKEIKFLDGGMGTSLSMRGKDSSPLSNIENPADVIDIHRGFIQAGSDIIETNTFTANPYNYKNYRRLIKEGVNLAQKAVGLSKRKDIRIASSIGPISELVAPLGKLEFEDAVDIFKKTSKAFFNSGLNLIILETMDDILQMRAALIGIREVNPHAEIFATMTFSDSGRTTTGTPAEAAAAAMDALGADVIGANCSFGPRGLYSTLKRMRKVTRKPLMVQPNAGLPQIKNGSQVYTQGPDVFAHRCDGFPSTGVSYIGGCCGTGAEHIAALKRKLKNASVSLPPKKIPLIISSRTSFTRLGDFPVIIGERINFSARPRLRESEEKVVAQGLKQKKARAAALDVNMGSHEEKTLDTVLALERRVGLPVVLDSQNAGEVEKAARRYPGVLLLNSVPGEKEKMDSLFPVVRKYGLPFIALCVRDKDVPRSAEDKLSAAKSLLKRASKEGIDTERALVDPLVLTLSSDPMSAFQTLKALEELKLKSVLGVSNVSSSLPQRALLNQVFSSLAVYCGVSALIADPLDSDLVYSLYASALLSGRDRGASEYLKFFSPASEELSFSHPLSRAIFEGSPKAAADYALQAMQKTPPLEVVETLIAPALDIVGQQYSQKKIFLPQLIQAARSCEKAMEEVEKKLKSFGGKRKIKGRIVIATVKDDIHDIGKNLVTLLLKNSSFEVIDLGVDVSSERIVSEAIKREADIIALSALMTNTMRRMEEVRELLDKKNTDIAVLAGGAAVTGSYAKSIGASYASDAVKAVKEAERIVSKK